MIIQHPGQGQVRPVLDAARLGLAHLEALVAIDSASDERSDTCPSTPGQRVIAAFLADFFRGVGADVSIDDHGNVLAALPGRGVGVGQSPIALMAHLDTARGTAPLPRLHLQADWSGGKVPYPANDGLCVDVDTYPATVDFVGHTIVFGDGKAPFGLDDKLGLAHIMTLAVLLTHAQDAVHPPLLLIARPDEEIGRMAAVVGLADTLAERGVALGWTIDGIAPFEINVENFFATAASIRFPARRVAPSVRHSRAVWRLAIGGVNTHGATAKAEGARAATRLAFEICAALDTAGIGDDVVAVGFASDPVRDCDGVLELAIAADAAKGVEAVVLGLAEALVAPHLRRGASLNAALTSTDGVDLHAAGAVADAIAMAGAVLGSGAIVPTAAEDSEGRQGYSNPYRIVADGDGVQLDVRMRDFDRGLLDRRGEAVRAVTPAHAAIEIRELYVNMGERLAGVPALIDLPKLAAMRIGVEAPVLPIRGGTGVDPFLDRGVFIANLGTGYFAPESEKELTSLELIGDHARWLVELVRVVAEA